MSAAHDDHQGTHHRVVVIGGGNAGLSVAGRLRRSGIDDVAVIDPSDTHVFRPLQSHIAGGVARAHEAVRPQASVIPRGVAWIQDAAAGIDPEARAVTLASGSVVRYDQLVVCPGIQRDWDAIPGLRAAMDTPAGISNYELGLAVKASAVLRDLRSGTAVFVQAASTSSCPGAAQKPMYLACAWWRSLGVLDDIRVVLVIPEPALFEAPEVAAELERKIDEYGIEVRYSSDLLEVDADARTVVIGRGAERESIAYDVLHAAPPQSAPDWLAATSLAGDDGFVDVDPETFQHARFADVWALGDAADLRSIRSGGAIRKQAKILAQNLVSVLDGREASKVSNGYTVCPFTVSRRTVVFAEMDRTHVLAPTVPGWRSLFRERRLSWVADRRVLPWVYWHLILSGRA